ncbi:MAG TPA: hypothetical protein VIQ05_07670 [Tardiphaga sp.]
MRKLSALCAAAGLTVTALAAASPAHAAFHLIRWQDTGFCQIWDQSIPTAPFPSNYTVLVNSATPTFLDALVRKDGLLRTGTCRF